MSRADHLELLPEGNPGRFEVSAAAFLVRNSEVLGHQPSRNICEPAHRVDERAIEVEHHDPDVARKRLRRG